MRIKIWIGVLLIGLGCGTTDKTSDGGSKSRETARVDPARVGLVLETPAPDVQTIQLYRGSDESSLPIVVMGSDGVLNLEFDILGQQSRSVRVEFEHRNRRWGKDHLLSPEYMKGRPDDEILDYRHSVAPRSDYVHYRYVFPNETIRFKRSGNYVLTVRNSSGDQEILFQQPFLVTEESADFRFELRNVSVPGAQSISNQPLALIDPETQIGRDLFDWGACFVRNTRFDLARCSGRPSLFDAPYATFTLDEDSFFEPEADLHVVDLGDLRPGLYIEDVSYETTPYEVLLVLDQADLGGIETSFGRGQSIVSGGVLDVGNPDVESEYVHATFRYIPYRSERVVGDVFITGSFNRWVLDAANRLAWNEAEGWYEATLLVKQGVHAYQYHIAGPRPSSRGVFTPESSYAALLYYFDTVVHADRLIAVRSRIVQ